MKTAMQELIFHIAYMERRKYQDEQTQILGGMNDCIMYDAIVIQNRVIEELTKEYSVYLEKEKEQMINFAYGFYDKCFTKDGIIQKSAGEYYNQTYNQNK
jgi:hypothetical protein